MKKFFKSVHNFIKETDTILILLCVLTSAFGCICVLSATQYTATEGSRFTRSFIVMAAAVGLGLILAVFISVIDYQFIMKIAPFIGAFCIAIMLFTLKFGVGPIERPDAKTWLAIGSTGIYFQPSELVKVGFIITFGTHLEKLKSNINHIFSILQLGVHAIIPTLLVVRSGDMGSALVFIIIALFMLFFAGLHWGYFLAGGLAGLASLPLLWTFILGNIQKERILALIHPDLYPDILYQQEHGLAAISGGGLIGQGLFQGIYTQQGAVPESENDMIFSVIGEEFGIIGCIMAILMLVFISMRIARTGKHDIVGDTKVMCHGVSAMILGQAIINIGMCLKLLPVIGITLPFFSSGGSSNLCIYLAIGLILSFYRYNQQRDIIDVKLSSIDNPFN